MCLGFDMKIKVFDPYVTEDVIKSFGGSKIENIDEGHLIVIFYQFTCP